MDKLRAAAAPSSSADSIRDNVTQALTACLGRAENDPFTNPFLLFAFDLGRRLDADELSLDQISGLVETLTVEAFEARAARLGKYLGCCDVEALSVEVTSLLAGLASESDFESFAVRVARAPFGLVLTGHPTFSLRRDLSELMVELATGFDAQGCALSDAQRSERLKAARTTHGPPLELSLNVEHAWSADALQNVHRALDVIYHAVFTVARKRWPDRWTELRPALITLATWVGFDQDGRTDVSWQVSFEKRLQLKARGLQMRGEAVRRLVGGAQGAWRVVLEKVLAEINSAIAAVERQQLLLNAAQADAACTGNFAQVMVAERDVAMVDSKPLLERLDVALAKAPDDVARTALLSLRAGVAATGLSLASIHVRLNAGQLHNAIRSQIALDTNPTDPANRRTYFTSIERLIERVQPVQINFGDLIEEPASARRLMMTLAQMRKFVDASTPVRFLIAETETGFTLLTALYYARLFGVDDIIEISPLFETEEALERGERVVEEALRSPVFTAYLQSHGRLAIEFGFSDSGRFIGQMAATFRIERLRLRLAQLLQNRGLGDLEIVFFNTHGESLGRGGHPGSLGDRFRYAAPPMSRREFAQRSIRIKEEDAFQGGEGYLPLMSVGAALSTLVAALKSVLCEDLEAEGDPIYMDQDYASEFFATVQKAFTSLVHDPDYAALVGLFGTHLLPKTGSRPVQRQSGDAGRLRTLARVSQLRAIPNNGVLQQLGYLANTLFGVGLAALKDRETFEFMRSRSPRFRRALALAEEADAVSDLRVLRAYAATVEPAAWLARAASGREAGPDLAVSQVADRTGLADPMARVTRRLQSEEIAIRSVFAARQDPRRRRLLLLHGLRIALIQRISRLCVQFPDFTPSGELSRQVLQERLLRLDLPEALEQLAVIFPIRPEQSAQIDFHEPSGYAPAVPHAYRREHEAIFAPMRRLFDLAIAISSAITHDIGAIG